LQCKTKWFIFAYKLGRMEKKGFRFKDGDEVAHVDNLGLKMHISRLIKKVKKEPTGKMCDGKPVYETFQILIGIECHWFQVINEVKEFRKHRFHSRELLPWDVAQEKLKKYEKAKVH
jgi:uncharacterized protein YodC (DUF2158 family)